MYINIKKREQSRAEREKEKKGREPDGNEKGLIWCQQKRTADNCGTSGTEGFQRFVRARFAQQTGERETPPEI
jgi:hypothetical protein